MLNRPSSNRRFRVIATDQIVAIVDSARGWTKYAPLCIGDDGPLLIIDETRTYWADELEELR